MNAVASRRNSPLANAAVAGAALATPAALAQQPPALKQKLEWLEDLSSALDHAANTNEEMSWSGDSDRILRAAHELADQLHIHPDQPGACGSIANRAYTIAALIKAAVQVTGDTPSAERLAFIEQARAPLAGLTEDARILDGWETYVRPCATCDQPPGLGPCSADPRPPAYQREVMRAICAHISHAEAVASVVAEDCGTDLGWGVIYAIRGLLRRVTDIEQQTSYGTGPLTVFSDVFCEVASLVALIKHVNLTENVDLLDAAATLLQAAGDTADKMIDAMAARAQEDCHA